MHIVIFIPSHFEMSRLSMHRRAIAICFFFHALQTGGVRIHPTVQQGNDSLAQDFVYGAAKPDLASLKSNSTEAIILGKGSSTWDEPYFAVHHTSIGGPNDNCYGLHVTMDVYGHELKPGQQTSTTIWVGHKGDGAASSFNEIQVGWHIYPDHYGNSQPHFYTQWTRDGYEETGCFNMDCPGFVRANGAVVAPGNVIHPVSDVPSGRIQKITLRVLKDKTSGDWWVYYGFNKVPTGVGYFPRSLFTYLAQKSNGMAFGAAAMSKKALPSPPMGSGVSPNGGRGRAASLTDIQLIDEDGRSRPIMADLPKIVTNEKCHSITPIDHAKCLYGGPGGCVR